MIMIILRKKILVKNKKIDVIDDYIIVDQF